MNRVSVEVISISSFGKEIRAKRKEYKLTQELLTREIGVSRQYIMQIESNKVFPSEEMQQAILEAIERFNPDTPLDLLIDYCRIRFPTTDVKIVVEKILGLQMKLFAFQEHSYWGYMGQYFRGDVVVMVSESQELGVMLELKGKGCRQFESYLNAQKTNGKQRGWINFLRDCLNADGRIKRLDLAINDKSGILNILYFIEKMRREEYKSIFHGFMACWWTSFSTATKRTQSRRRTNS